MAEEWRWAAITRGSVGAQVGKVVAGFEEKEMWEATLTVFTTDNGS